MNKDKALELALEAWQTSVYGSESHHKAMLLAMTNMAQALAAPVQTDWEAIAADQAMTIALLKSEAAAQPATEKSSATQPVQEPVIDHSCKDTYELIMKWADIYAAQTGKLYAQAAQDPSKVARMADERTMLACVVAQALSQPAAPMQRRGHITDGSPCWCNPDTDYVDPETGIAVIVHKEPQ